MDIFGSALVGSVVFLEGSHVTAPNKQFAEFASRLPEPAELERRWRIISVIFAAADAERFIYEKSYKDTETRVGIFENGGGDSAGVFFTDNGAFIRVFDHESEMSPYEKGKLWPGLIDGLPEQFKPYLSAAVFSDEPEFPAMTLALWNTGDGWQHGKPQLKPNGEEPEATDWMFRILLEDYERSKLTDFINGVTGSDLTEDAIGSFLNEELITREQVQALSADDEHFELIRQAIEETSYPAEL